MRDPTNADIMKFLEKIDNRLNTVENKLETLHSLECKVDNFEKEMCKMWNYIQDENKITSEKINMVSEKAESTDFNLGIVTSRVHNLEIRNKQLSDELVYMQSQSMRYNIVFGNLDEVPTGEPENTESLGCDFLVVKMKIATDLVRQTKFERVHRMGERRPGKIRPIVAKFNLSKEREMVRKAGSSLKGTRYFIHEQFPKEVSDKRRKLIVYYLTHNLDLGKESQQLMHYLCYLLLCKITSTITNVCIVCL